MTVHLDTSFLIRALVAGSVADDALRRWLAEGCQVEICSVAWAEFLCGSRGRVESAPVRRVLDACVAVTEEDAVVAARLFNDSGRRRGTLGDCLIAAVAIRCGAALATVNQADFRRFEPAGLVLVPV